MCERAGTAVDPACSPNGRGRSAQSTRFQRAAAALAAQSERARLRKPHIRTMMLAAARTAAPTPGIVDHGAGTQ
jgi:hypothetical protein